jgi:hypothetical protein
MRQEALFARSSCPKLPPLRPLLARSFVIPQTNVFYTKVQPHQNFLNDESPVTENALRANACIEALKPTQPGLNRKHDS